MKKISKIGERAEKKLDVNFINVSLSTSFFKILTKIDRGCLVNFLMLRRNGADISSTHLKAIYAFVILMFLNYVNL